MSPSGNKQALKNHLKRRKLIPKNLKRSLRRDSNKIGLPPGTLIDYEEKAPVQYEIFEYNKGEYREQNGTGLPEMPDFHSPENITWMNIVGVEDKAVLERLGSHFHIHPVVLEDIQNTVQRPKIEDYGDLVFFTMRMLRWNEEDNDLISEQLSILIGDNFVLSFQERPGDVFDGVRQRIREGKGRVRQLTADYLGYALLDLVVDTYFLIMERLEELMEDVEEEILDGSRNQLMQRLQIIRKMVITVRRAVWPLREVMNQVQKLELPYIKEATQIYFKDLYDHILRIIDTLEQMRETSATLTDTYQSSLSNDMNSVMKVLTIIATIFIPLTFIAGIYGMNFQNMPELAVPWAYPLVLSIMGLVALVMLIFFKIKKWL